MKSPLKLEGRLPLRLLSVVIPARNEFSSVTATVEHLDLELRLHGIEHEIIVVDDGSTDSTRSVLCELKNQIATLVPVPNSGQNGCGRAPAGGFGHVHRDAAHEMLADES